MARGLRQFAAARLGRAFGLPHDCRYLGQFQPEVEPGISSSGGAQSVVRRPRSTAATAAAAAFPRPPVRGAPAVPTPPSAAPMLQSHQLGRRRVSVGAVPPPVLRVSRGVHVPGGHPLPAARVGEPGWLRVLQSGRHERGRSRRQRRPGQRRRSCGLREERRWAARDGGCGGCGGCCDYCWCHSDRVGRGSASPHRVHELPAAPSAHKPALGFVPVSCCSPHRSRGHL